MKENVVSICFMLMLYLPQPSPGQRLVPPGKNFEANENDYHPNYNDDIDEEEYISINNTGKEQLTIMIL